jgi:hypothetical protein
VTAPPVLSDRCSTRGGTQGPRAQRGATRRRHEHTAMVR